MDREYELLYHRVEKEHWWFVTRRELIYSLLSKTPKDSRILDIGCSSGLLLRGLVDMGFNEENLYGVDISENAIHNCRLNDLANTFVMDAQDIRLDTEKFDILIASDCLEHLPDDRKALNNWHGLLSENGILIIFVPAFSFLWSQHDVVNKHVKRYTGKELSQLVVDSDYLVKRSGYWNFFLFLPVFFIRFVNNLLNRQIKETGENKEGDIALPPGFINRVLILLLRIENSLIRLVRFPFGVSTFIIATKLNEKQIY